MYVLKDNFNYFFKQINPSPTYVSKASSQYSTVKSLIESNSLTSELKPVCFLQGSYRQQTATYTIDDIDIVVLCSGLTQGGSTGKGTQWTRDEIFNLIATPLLLDGRYRDKVYYHQKSMCIKLSLGIKIEILPVVYAFGENTKEPYRAYYPEVGQWKDVYPRKHQELLSWKNNNEKTQGNFIPAVKVFKHIRSSFSQDISSFYLECLLYSLPDELFRGSPATYISSLTKFIASYPASIWYEAIINQPSQNRSIFLQTELDFMTWSSFHAVITSLDRFVQIAINTDKKEISIDNWQIVLGDRFFPRNPS